MAPPPPQSVIESAGVELAGVVSAALLFVAPAVEAASAEAVA